MGPPIDFICVHQRHLRTNLRPLLIRSIPTKTPSSCQIPRFRPWPKIGRDPGPPRYDPLRRKSRGIDFCD